MHDHQVPLSTRLSSLPASAGRGMGVHVNTSHDAFPTALHAETGPATALDLCGETRHRHAPRWLTDVRPLGRECPPRSDQPGPRPRRRSIPQCPRRRGEVVNTTTGVTVRAQCGALKCHACIIGRAIRVGQAIALAAPTQTMTVSVNAEDWTSIKLRFQAFGRRLRAQGLHVAYCYHVEPYATRGNHAHLFLRGDPVPTSKARLACESAGFGFNVWSAPWVTRSDHYRHPTIDYGVKMILRLRPDEPTALWPEAETYLRLNGNRLVHTTRGFWLDSDGQPCTVREAIRSTQAATSGRWVFVGDAA